MKIAHHLIATLVLCAAGTSFAAAPQATDTVQPALTRAEVRAQVIEARRNGTLIESEADRYAAETHYLMTGRPFGARKPTTTRADLRAGVIVAQRSGMLATTEAAR